MISTWKKLLLSTSLALLTVATWGQAARAGKNSEADNGKQTYLYLVFSNPVAGQEQRFNDWYSNRHIHDVLSVPGFQSAQRYVLADDQLRRVPLVKPRYLAVYTIETEDLPRVSAEIMRRLQSGETKIDPSFEQSSFEAYVFRVFRPEQKGVGGEAAHAQPGTVTDYAQVVFGDAVAGQDKEFNEWYDKVHEPGLLAVPGFTSALRGVRSEVQMGNAPTPSRYLALFTMRTRDLKALLAGLPADMPLSPAFDKTRTFGYTYRAIGPLERAPRK